MKSIERGHLKREPIAAERHQLGGERVVSGDAFAHLDDGLHRFAPLLVGHADGGDVAHGGVLEDHGVDLGRVDVHAARDDELGAAAGEEEDSRRRPCSPGRRA